MNDRIYTITLDDDPTVKSLIEDYTGIETIFFTRSETLISKTALYEPIAIFLDIFLDSMDNGLRHIPALKKAWPYSPLIVMTGNGSKSLLEDALNSGADDFISKPLDRTELVARLQSRLRIGSSLQKKSVKKLFDLELDTFNRIIRTKHGQKSLNPKDLEFFDILLDGNSMVVCKDKILNHVWKGSKISASTLDRKVHDLRQILKELESNTIITNEFGVGYRMCLKEIEKNSKILVVDDNELNCDLIAAMFQHLGFKVEQCANGKEALERASLHHFDLVLMDCQMPELDGFGATQQIRADTTSKDSVIVAMSGRNDEKTIQECLDSGMNEVLFKPIRIENIETLIDKYVSKKGGRSLEGPQLSLHFRNLDEKYLNELVALSPNDAIEFLKKLFSNFEKVSATPARELLIEPDVSDEHAMRLAHKLRGMAANIGATKLSSVFEKLELLYDERFMKKHQHGTAEILECKFEAQKIYDDLGSEIEKFLERR